MEIVRDPDGRCNLVALAVRRFCTCYLVLQIKTESAEIEGYLPILLFRQGLFMGERPFQDKAIHAKSLS